MPRFGNRALLHVRSQPDPAAPKGSSAVHCWTIVMLDVLRDSRFKKGKHYCTTVAEKEEWELLLLKHFNKQSLKKGSREVLHLQTMIFIEWQQTVPPSIAWYLTLTGQRNHAFRWIIHMNCQTSELSLFSLSIVE